VQCGWSNAGRSYSDAPVFSGIPNFFGRKKSILQVYMYTHILFDLNSKSPVPIQPINRSAAASPSTRLAHSPPKAHQALIAALTASPRHSTRQPGLGSLTNPHCWRLPARPLSQP
jgi:hypothetical protein